MQMQAHLVPSPSDRMVTGSTVVASLSRDRNWPDRPNCYRAQIGGDLVRLIADACGSLDSDLEGTRAALQRALALLEAERAPASVDPATGRCALAAWQVRRVVSHVERNLASNICIGDLAT